MAEKKKKAADNQVCKEHGAAHVYNVECKMDPQWTNIYIYRNACKCGDVQTDWHR